MSFAQDVDRWATKALSDQRQILRRTAELAYESIVEGSTITGSPGQPKLTGELKGSWELEMQENGAVISTDLFWAPWIEDGVLPEGRELRVGQSGGGPHSLKLTIAGLPRLVEQAVREVVRV